MATVLRFPVPPSGDWSPSERARLDELAARFAEQADVEVVFGRSDSGDPWCVVLDAQDEVLIHVARERGAFVAHAAAPDVFVRSADLRTAVDRVLGSRWLEERSDVVVPVASGSRAVQMVTAVLIVGSFVEHHRAEAEPAEEWTFAAARPLKPGTRDTQRDDAAKVAPIADDTPTFGYQPGGVPAASAKGYLPPLPLAPALDPMAGDEPGHQLATRLIAASGESDRTVAEIVVGTAGDDVLDGRQSPPGTYDLLDAGAGDDRLLLDGGTIAIGGDGADQFLIRAPETAAGLPLLGVIADFDPAVDQLLTEGSGTLTVVATLPTRNIFADPNVNLSPAPALPGAQLIVDINGDGRGDGYLLVNGVDPGIERLEAIRQVVSELNAPPPPTVVVPEAEPRPAPSSAPAATAGREPEAGAPQSTAVSEPEATLAAVPGAEAKAPPAPRAAPEAEPEAPPVLASVSEREREAPSSNSMKTSDAEAPPTVASTTDPEAGAARSIDPMIEFPAGPGAATSLLAIVELVDRPDMLPTPTEVI